MHELEGLGLMEVIDQHDDPVPDGIGGVKLLANGFIKRTQPVLRYEISDMVATATTPAPAGARSRG